MTKPFIGADFLLQNSTARELYHEMAEHLPIIDYHCHLDPKLIAEDHRFHSISELWLGGDHYKWRAMRANGVDERYITGDAADFDKFQKWAETLPYALRNPLYHWSHLELKTAFGIDTLLNPETAKEIYDKCNDMLRHDPDMTARGLMRHYGVEVVCTTDDPLDTLVWHKEIRESGFECKVLPTWRPDKAMAVEDSASFVHYLTRLAEVSEVEISDMQSFLSALRKRHDFFETMGCKLSDHGLSEFYGEDYTENQVERIFQKVIRDGAQLDDYEVRVFKSAMLDFFARLDNESGWVQQFHYGALRNTNTKMFQTKGADTGHDSIGQCLTAQSMAHFLDRLNTNGCLPKTIIYNLNPADNEMVATMIGNFQDGTVPGKMQWGAGWWFLDQKDGMQKQMNALSLQGLLSRFVGMLTDSRSFLSYPRHEYFRRVLCNMIGTDIEAGEVPYEGYERERVRQMVADICYNNAKSYFDF